jgi:hypothetical protein
MKNEQPATGKTDGKITLGRIGRMFVFFLTAGFMYPNVFIEGMDPTRIQGLTEGELYNKK